MSSLHRVKLGIVSKVKGYLHTFVAQSKVRYATKGENGKIIYEKF